jgi:hypothetical protein
MSQYKDESHQTFASQFMFENQNDLASQCNSENHITGTI